MLKYLYNDFVKIDVENVLEIWRKIINTNYKLNQRYKLVYL